MNPNRDDLLFHLALKKGEASGGRFLCVEDRRDFAKGRADLKRALGDKPGHDRGYRWWNSYGAESRQREAEAVFKAKGIPLPEPDAK